MFAATYSIVAHDPEAHAWGVAVASKFPAVGALIPYAEVDAGAIATQALINTRYGPDGLALLRQGRSASEVVEVLTSADPDASQRQVGIVDREGRVQAFTGADCMNECGSRSGRHYSVQGNLLAREEALDRMSQEFERHHGEALEMRMLHALRAAQDAGGDRRGQQAAALRVAQHGRGFEGCDIKVDLRVDDHDAPLEELSRLLEIHRFHFEPSPADDFVPVDATCRQELSALLHQLGYTDRPLEEMFYDWICTENLEARYDGLRQIDPVVLRHLRQTATATSAKAR